MLEDPRGLPKVWDLEPQWDRTPPELQPYRAMWQAALATLLADAGSVGTTPEARQARAEARSYLSAPSADLHKLLELCGLDPSIWPQAVRALRLKWQAADAAGSPGRTMPAESRARIAAAARERHAARRLAEVDAAAA